MTDKIPAFKSEIDDIHVPIEKLDAIILETVNRSEPRRKKSIGKRLLYTASAAVVALGLLVGSATVSPVMANIVSHIPLIGAVFSQSEDRGLVQVNESGLTQIVGESKTVGGITVTIDEVFYDDTRFTFSYSLESEQPLGEFYLSPGFTIDGESSAPSGMGSSEYETLLTPTHRTGIYSIGSYGSDLPEKFDLGLYFEGKAGEIWEFSIPVKKLSDVRYIAVNQAKQMNDIEVNILDLKSGPGGLLLKYQTRNVSKHLEPLYLHTFIKFRIMDSEGNELIAREGSATGRFHMKGSLLFDPVDENATELIIMPYITFPKQGEWGHTDWNGNVKDVDMTPYEGKDFIFDTFTVSLP